MTLTVCVLCHAERCFCSSANVRQAVPTATSGSKRVGRGIIARGPRFGMHVKLKDRKRSLSGKNGHNALWH